MVALLFLIPTAPAAVPFEGYLFHVGDPHVHTGFSADGGSVDLGAGGANYAAFADLTTTARANGLDWMVAADHVQGNVALSPEAWPAYRDAVLADNADGVLVIPGGEAIFTLESGVVLGHKTLALFGSDEELGDLELAELQPQGEGEVMVPRCAAIGDWMETLTSTHGAALLFPHHPAAYRPMPTDWSCHDARFEPAVEVYSAHGNSLDLYPTYDPPVFETSTGSAAAALDPAGFALELGFLGGTDSHDTRPGSVCDLDEAHRDFPYGGGLTLLVLPEEEALTRGSVYDALLQHHTWVSTGPAVPARVLYSTGGVLLGEVGDPLGVPVEQALDIEIHLPEADAAAVRSVQVVSDSVGRVASGRVDGVYAVTVPAGERPTWIYVSVELDGVRPDCVDGGADAREYLWSSPSWIHVVPPDLDGDGWSVAQGDCDDADPSRSPGTAEVWYDGVDQDCAGDSDYDRDADGEAAIPHGTDCDDADPTRIGDCRGPSVAPAGSEWAGSPPAGREVPPMAEADGCGGARAAGLLPLLPYAFRRRRPLRSRTAR